MRFTRAELARRIRAKKAIRGGAASANRLPPRECETVLGVTGRQVVLRFRGPGVSRKANARVLAAGHGHVGDEVYGEVVSSLRSFRVTVVPWGAAGRRFTFDTRDLQSVLVAAVGKHEEYAKICRRQAQLAAAGRFEQETVR